MTQQTPEQVQNKPPEAPKDAYADLVREIESKIENPVEARKHLRSELERRKPSAQEKKELIDRVKASDKLKDKAAATDILKEIEDHESVKKQGDKETPWYASDDVKNTAVGVGVGLGVAGGVYLLYRLFKRAKEGVKAGVEKTKSGMRWLWGALLLAGAGTAGYFGSKWALDYMVKNNKENAEKAVKAMEEAVQKKIDEAERKAKEASARAAAEGKKNTERAAEAATFPLFAKGLLVYATAKETNPNWDEGKLAKKTHINSILDEFEKKDKHMAAVFDRIDDQGNVIKPLNELFPAPKNEEERRNYDEAARMFLRYCHESRHYAKRLGIDTKDRAAMEKLPIKKYIQRVAGGWQVMGKLMDVATDAKGNMALFIGTLKGKELADPHELTGEITSFIQEHKKSDGAWEKCDAASLFAHALDRGNVNIQTYLHGVQAQKPFTPNATEEEKQQRLNDEILASICKELQTDTHKYMLPFFHGVFPDEEAGAAKEQHPQYIQQTVLLNKMPMHQALRCYLYRRMMAHGNPMGLVLMQAEVLRYIATQDRSLGNRLAARALGVLSRKTVTKGWEEFPPDITIPPEIQEQGKQCIKFIVTKGTEAGLWGIVAPIAQTFGFSEGSFGETAAKVGAGAVGSVVGSVGAWKAMTGPRKYWKNATPEEMLKRAKSVGGRNSSWWKLYELIPGTVNADEAKIFRSNMEIMMEKLKKLQTNGATEKIGLALEKDLYRCCQGASSLESWKQLAEAARKAGQDDMASIADNIAGKMETNVHFRRAVQRIQHPLMNRIPTWTDDAASVAIPSWLTRKNAGKAAVDVSTPPPALSQADRLVVVEKELKDLHAVRNPLPENAPGRVAANQKIIALEAERLALKKQLQSVNTAAKGASEAAPAAKVRNAPKAGTDVPAKGTHTPADITNPTKSAGTDGHSAKMSGDAQPKRNQLNPVNEGPPGKVPARSMKGVGEAVEHGTDAAADVTKVVLREPEIATWASRYPERMRLLSPVLEEVKVTRGIDEAVAVARAASKVDDAAKLGRFVRLAQAVGWKNLIPIAGDAAAIVFSAVEIADTMELIKHTPEGKLKELYKDRLPMLRAEIVVGTTGLVSTGVAYAAAGTALGTAGTTVGVITLPATLVLGSAYSMHKNDEDFERRAADWVREYSKQDLTKKFLMRSGDIGNDIQQLLDPRNIALSIDEMKEIEAQKRREMLRGVILHNTYMGLQTEGGKITVEQKMAKQRAEEYMTAKLDYFSKVTGGTFDLWSQPEPRMSFIELLRNSEAYAKAKLDDKQRNIPVAEVPLLAEKDARDRFGKLYDQIQLSLTLASQEEDAVKAKRILTAVKTQIANALGLELQHDMDGLLSAMQNAPSNSLSLGRRLPNDRKSYEERLQYLQDLLTPQRDGRRMRMGNSQSIDSFSAINLQEMSINFGTKPGKKERLPSLGSDIEEQFRLGQREQFAKECQDFVTDLRAIIRDGYVLRRT